MRNYRALLEHADMTSFDGRIRIQPEDDFVIDVIDTKVQAIDDLAPRYRAILKRHPVLRESGIESRYFDIVMASDDLRDAIGFVLAAYNSHLFATHGILPEDAPLIDHDGMALHNPYADETHGEWCGSTRTDWGGNEDGRALVLTDPRELPWGDKYDAWLAEAEGLEPIAHPAP